MKRAIITGGSDGLGEATAKALAEKGFEVIIASQSLIKCKKVAGEIIESTGNTNVHGMQLDLADLDQVEKFSTEYKNRFDTLDVLVNNAALVTDKYSETEQGFEKQLGVDHLGHFYLTSLMYSQLISSQDPRLVVLSSEIHRNGSLDINLWEGDKYRGEYSSFGGYSRAKLANLLFAREMAKRHHQIRTFAIHPGLVNTGLGSKHTGWMMKIFWNVFAFFGRNPEKGAETTNFAVSADDLPKSGSYLADKKIKRPSNKAQDDELAKQLWEKSVEMLKKAGYTKGEFFKKIGSLKIRKL